MPKLMFVRGLREGEAFTFAPPGIFLGRETDNDLQLLTDGVSRYHAKLTEGDGIWQLTDLGSSNGTKVNGAKVASHTLSDGDLINLGKVVLRFIAAPPPASPEKTAPVSADSPPPPTKAEAESSRRRFREREREIQRLITEAVTAKHRRLRRIALLIALLLNMLLLAGFVYYQIILKNQ